MAASAACHFTPEDFSGKSVCKSELQKMLNLPQKPETPIVSMVSRLVGSLIS